MKSAHESPAEADSKQKMVIHVPRRYTALFLNMIFDVICHICFFFCSLLAAWGLVRHWRNPQKKSCVWRRFCKTVAGHLPWKLFSVSFVVLQGRRPTLAYSFMSWQRNGKQHIAACNQQKSRSQDFSVRDFSQEYNYIQMQWERRIGLSVSLNPYRQYHAIFVENHSANFNNYTLATILALESLDLKGLKVLFFTSRCKKIDKLVQQNDPKNTFKK